jgi:mannose-6-phosphate isomerase-like protein (cupin superfamily)
MTTSAPESAAEAAEDHIGKSFAPATEYERWMADQEIPIVYEFGVTNVRDLERAPWTAVGCRAAFIQLYGMEGFTGMFVGELAPGEQTRPQKHLYEELVMVFDGHGEIEIWEPGSAGAERQVLAWQPYSLFSIPLNCWYTMRNTGSGPAVFVSVTNAPLVMDLFHDRDFVFQNDYHFASRFTASDDFGSRAERLTASTGVRALRADIIKDVVDLPIDVDERRGTASKITVFEMAGNTLAGHLAEWPPRRRQKAHYHAPGAVLLIARSQGYSLMWPSQAGLRPYESGNEDEVVRVEWREGSAFCPPDQWFHQHFNTGDVPAKQVAIRYGSSDHPAGFAAGLQTPKNRGIVPTRTSIREGGTSIEFEDEDPRIFADYRRIVGDLA